MTDLEIDGLELQIALKFRTNLLVTSTTEKSEFRLRHSPFCKFQFSPLPMTDLEIDCLELQQH